MACCHSDVPIVWFFSFQHGQKIENSQQTDICYAQYASKPSTSYLQNFSCVCEILDHQLHVDGLDYHHAKLENTHIKALRRFVCFSACAFVCICVRVCVSVFKVTAVYPLGDCPINYRSTHLLCVVLLSSIVQWLNFYITITEQVYLNKTTC